MPDWTPPISTMSEERYTILQLIKLCKRYQVGMLAANAAIQFLAQENFQVGHGLQETLRNEWNRVGADHKTLHSRDSPVTNAAHLSISINHLGPKNQWWENANVLTEIPQNRFNDGSSAFAPVCS